MLGYPSAGHKYHQTIFFPSEICDISQQILSVFVAWINLDLGIEACFYSGMDANGMNKVEKRMHCKGPPITEVLETSINHVALTNSHLRLHTKGL